MYQLVSSVSLIIRFVICYKTIEQFPIFSNEAIEWILGQVISIYTILRVICYGIVGYISARQGIIDPTGRAIVYFLVYLPIVAVVWGILWILTWLQVLPIGLA